MITKLTIMILSVDDLRTCLKIHNNRLEVGFGDLLKLLVSLESLLSARTDEGLNESVTFHFISVVVHFQICCQAINRNPLSCRVGSRDSKPTRSLSKSSKLTSNLLLCIFEHVVRSSTNNGVIVSLVAVILNWKGALRNRQISCQHQLLTCQNV